MRMDGFSLSFTPSPTEIVMEAVPLPSPSSPTPALIDGFGDGGRVSNGALIAIRMRGIVDTIGGVVGHRFFNKTRRSHLGLTEAETVQYYLI